MQLLYLFVSFPKVFTVVMNLSQLLLATIKAGVLNYRRYIYIFIYLISKRKRFNDFEMKQIYFADIDKYIQQFKEFKEYIQETYKKTYTETACKTNHHKKKNKKS